MKVLLALFLLAISSVSLLAQNGDVTIILLRHAEKDLSPGSDKVDPNLSAEGKQRADRLVETIRKYKPNQIFSTNFKRTISTVTPLADNIDPIYRIQIQKYDYNELQEFADRLLKMNGTVVVAGHNTTTPMLANMLVKQETKYGALNENEYNKIWIIKIKKNKIKDIVIEY